MCCVCGCEHTDEIEPMVKACNCLGGGAIAHRDCLEDWEDEDKCISKNVDKSKKGGTTENRGSENRKTKMVDGIIVDVIDNAVAPSHSFWHTIVESLGRLSWKEMSSMLRFWRSRQRRHQERERRRSDNPKPKKSARRSDSDVRGRTRKPCEETDQVRLKRY